MRGAIDSNRDDRPEGVSEALFQALSPSEPLSKSAIGALMHMIARECYWRIESFDWRIVHRTYHKCFAEREGRKFVALIGADSPILALSDLCEDGAWLFFDDASIGAVATGYYGPTLKCLSAQQLNSDLSECDRHWLAGLSKSMAYDLKYWTPGTVGDVVFNYWD